MPAAQRRGLIEQVATELFAEHGYRGTSMEDIAKRSGVSVPVVYDHFPSKQQLHEHLLERHFAELRQLWRTQLGRKRPLEQRIATTLDAWFGYVEAHPYAWRLLFRDTTGDSAVHAMHHAAAEASKEAILPQLFTVLPAEMSEPGHDEQIEMVWEIVRSALQGLALWWHENQHVSRDQIVATAMNVLWIGFERFGAGTYWPAE